MSEDGEPKSKKAKRSSSSAADTITGEVSEERKQLLESKVLVKMPEDFYLFWEFCFDRSDGKPAAVLNPCGLRYSTWQNAHRGLEVCLIELKQRYQKMVHKFEECREPIE